MQKKKIKAYSVFEGGGIKGLALAGAYDIAADEHVELLGHAGASVGSIIAFLANIGLSGKEISAVISSNHSKMFGPAIKFLYKAWTSGNVILLALAVPYAAWKLYWHKGVCTGKEIKEILNVIAREKASLDQGFTFSDLYKYSKKPLKIIATDILGNRPIFYSHEETPNACVVSAIIASCSYPFVFSPHKTEINGIKTVQVDGGISSNLPSFLFGEESRREKCSIFCFDLVSPEVRNKEPTSGFFRYLFSIINAAIEADSHITRRIVPNIHTIPIRTPSDIDTFSIDIKSSEIEKLFNCGYKDANEYFRSLNKLHRANAKEKATSLTKNLAPLDAFATIVQQLRSTLIKATPSLGESGGFDIWLYIPTLYASFVSIASTEDDSWKEISDESQAIWKCWEKNEIECLVNRDGILKFLHYPVSLRGRRAGVIFLKFKNGTRADSVFSNLEEKNLAPSIQMGFAAFNIICYLMLTNPVEDIESETSFSATPISG